MINKSNLSEDKKQFRHFQIINALKMGDISESDYKKFMSELGCC